MMIDARRQRSSLLVSLALALLVVAPAVVIAEDTASHEDLVVARTRMDAAAEAARKGRYALNDEEKRLRRELVQKAQKLHDQANALGETGGARTASLVRKMDVLRGELEDFSVRAEAAGPAPGAVPTYETAEPSMEPEAVADEESSLPEAEPGPADMQPIAVLTRFTDLAQDALDVKGRLSAVESARAAELIAEGDRLVHEVRQMAQRKHEEREVAVTRLYEIGTELRDINLLGVTDRRRGIPMVQARSVQVGWTSVGATRGAFEVLRARFIKPGSAYFTLRNASDAARACSVGLDFTDIVGDATGAGVYETGPNEDFRPGEVREVLVQIAPSVDRFWDVTTDFSIDVQ